MLRFFIALIVGLLGAFSVAAQTVIEVYADQGQKFTLYVNGKKVNDEPKIDVSAEVDSLPVLVEVVFEEPEWVDFQQTLDLDKGYLSRYSFKQYKHLTTFEKASAAVKRGVNTVVGEATGSPEHEPDEFVMLFKRKKKLGK